MGWLEPSTLRGRLATLWRPAAVFLAPGPQAQSGGPAGAAGGAEAVVPGHDQALMAWRDWCQAHPGQRCELGLSGQWLLQAVIGAADVAAPADLEDADQAIAACQQRWAHYFNVDADELAARWVMRSVRVQGGWLMCALPAALRDDLLAVAQASQVGIAWMGPWWARCGQRWQAHALAQSAAQELLAQEPGWSTCLRVDAGQTALAWAGPDAVATGAPATRPDAPKASRLRVAQGEAAAAGLLWDDNSTAGVLRGRAQPWLSLA